MVGIGGLAYNNRVLCSSAAYGAVCNLDAELLAGRCLKLKSLEGMLCCADILYICKRCDVSLYNNATLVAYLNVETGLLLCSIGMTLIVVTSSFA